MENRNLIGGLLAGAAIGVVIGLLFAPEKVVKALKKGASKVKDEAEDLMGDAVKMIEDRMEKGEKEFSRRAKETLKSTNEGSSYGQ